MLFATLTHEEKLLAACAKADPDFCFPEVGQRTTWPKKMCREECPVQTRCLEVSLINEEPFGVWGGYDERERRKMLRRKK